MASGHTTEPVSIVAVLENIVCEKRVQYRDHRLIEINLVLSEGYGLFAKINPTELSRAISNLINNSVEALNLGGRITIAVRDEGDNAVITIEDNGKGMPSEVLEILGRRGVSFGKEGSQSGSGLGLSHACETVRLAGGVFDLTSAMGEGTRVTLKIPKSERPEWFVEKILLHDKTVLVSASSNQSIHQIWSDRLCNLANDKCGVQHITFTSLARFEDWARTSKSGYCQFLIDYEFLDQNGTGLLMVERLGLGERSVLIASECEELQVRAKA